MLFLVSLFFINLSNTAAASSSGSCMDLFATSETREQRQMNKIFPSYRQDPKIANLMLRLMKQGVMFEFYNPKTEDTQSSRLHVEPIISANWKDGQFDTKNIRVFLPKNTTDIEPRSGHYQLLTHLARMNNILVFQKQGALFGRESMLFNHRVTLLGFKQNAQISNWTLSALQHAMTTFGIEKIGFEPLESVWAQIGLRPEIRITRNPNDQLELLIRSYYFERTDSWETLAAELETGMFRPYGRPFFPTQQTVIH